MSHRARSGHRSRSRDSRSDIQTARSYRTNAPDTSSANAIKVIVRIRPLRIPGSGLTSTSQLDNVGGSQSGICHPDPHNPRLVTLQELVPDGNPDNSGGDSGGGPSAASALQTNHVFQFDQVHGPNSTQKHVYDSTGAQATRALLQGYNATVLAYGQTGTGKTHTMEGFCYDRMSAKRGIIARCLDDLFHGIRAVSESSDNRIRFSVKVSYLQIYNEQCSDLLRVTGGSGENGGNSNKDQPGSSTPRSLPGFGSSSLNNNGWIPGLRNSADMNSDVNDLSSQNNQTVKAWNWSTRATDLDHHRNLDSSTNNEFNSGGGGGGYGSNNTTSGLSATQSFGGANSAQKLNIREDKRRGVYVDGLSEWPVVNSKDVYSLLQKGSEGRVMAETKSNDVSSRSHTVFTIMLEQNWEGNVGGNGSERREGEEGPDSGIF